MIPGEPDLSLQNFLMETFRAKVIRISNVAEKTISIELEKPIGFSFVAGQYSLLSVLNLVEQDSKGPHRCMSIASAPSDDHLLFAMRLSESGYKKSVARLSPGDEMIVGKPIGQFTLVSNDASPIVFLVGGIGITPARSILREANFSKDGRDFSLFYSNYRPEDTAFFEEFSIGFPDISFKNVLSMTDMEKSSRPWSGERGFITGEMIQKYVGDVSAAMYYLVGTLPFTRAMEGILADFRIGKDRIKQDPFIGL